MTRLYDDVQTYVDDVMRRTSPERRARIEKAVARDGYHDAVLDTYDYGVWWRDGEAEWPRYRLVWQADTEELYAVRLVGGGVKKISVAGQPLLASGFGQRLAAEMVVASAGEEKGTVEVIARIPRSTRVPDRGDIPMEDRLVEEALDGWPEHCGGPNGLQWVRARMVELGYREEE